MDLKEDLLDALRDVDIAILRRLRDKSEDKPGYAETKVLEQEEENIAALIRHYKLDDWKKAPEKVVEQEEETVEQKEIKEDERTDD